MSIEKMQVMNLLILKKDVYKVLEQIVLDGTLHINSSGNLKDRNFTLEFINNNKESLEKLGVTSENIRTYEPVRVFQKKEYQDKLNDLFSYLNIRKESVDFDKLEYMYHDENIEKINNLIRYMNDLKDKEYENRKNRTKLNELISTIKYFLDSDLKLNDFSKMSYINVDIGRINKRAFLKLKGNYENIKGLVIHIDQNQYGEGIIIFTPKIYEDETKYLLKSLNFNRVELPEIEKSFSSFIKEKSDQLEKLEKEQEEIEKSKEEFKNKYSNELLSFYFKYKIIEKIEQIEANVGMTDNFVLINGFVPLSRTEKLKQAIEKVSNSAYVKFSDIDEFKNSKNIKVPTKLKNNFLLKPFEELVKMYSVPNYNEVDPTLFFAITYMLLFGMMFGDVGQGLVFLIAGFVFSKKLGNIAKILERLGVSSIIFGFLYGSVFGMENIIKPIFIRPMENINTVLIISIILGVCLVTIAYLIGFYNLKKNKNYDILYFDKNGIAGFLFYFSFLGLMFNLFYLKNKLNMETSSLITMVTSTIMIVTCVIMFMKPKLANTLNKNKNFEKEKFSPIESGFSLLETIMGFFSNTLSFIRVGAFSINHVGLFMAFHALGTMIGGSFGNIFMIILGNIVIIFLEGLIVFIQAIRLEYYELFSKYFTGDGILYDPIKVERKK